jgi:hypothetical protein
MASRNALASRRKCVFRWVRPWGARGVFSCLCKRVPSSDFKLSQNRLKSCFTLIKVANTAELEWLGEPPAAASNASMVSVLVCGGRNFDDRPALMRPWIDYTQYVGLPL